MENNGDDSQVQRNCALCTNPDEHDDMVACDSCQLWHHYSCAKVSASVQDRKWYCPTCGPLCKEGTDDVPEKNDNPDPKQYGSDGGKSGTSKGFNESVAKKSDAKGAKPKVPVKQSENLEVPKKMKAKASAGSKATRKSKKTVGESATSSIRARLELELKAVEEQQKIQEEELAAEKELKDLERKLEEEMQEKEFAIETKRIAEAKAALRQKIADEREYKMQQMAIRRQSAEQKAKLIRQASEYGSSRSSLIGTDTDSKDKVEDWLKKSTQQTAGPIKEFTSALDSSSGPTQVPLEQNTNHQTSANIRTDRSLDLPPLTIQNKVASNTKSTHIQPFVSG